MEARTLNEIRIEGFRVLVEHLGPEDAIRFIQSYSHGSGDYTSERREALDPDFEQVIADIRKHRKQ